jgi:hypothetical protein
MMMVVCAQALRRSVEAAAGAADAPPPPPVPPMRDGAAWEHFCLGRRSTRGASAAADDAAAANDAEASSAEADAEPAPAGAPDAGDAPSGGHAPSLRVLTSFDEVCACFFHFLRVSSHFVERMFALSRARPAGGGDRAAAARH